MLAFALCTASFAFRIFFCRNCSLFFIILFLISPRVCLSFGPRTMSPRRLRKKLVLLLLLHYHLRLPPICVFFHSCCDYFNLLLCIFRFYFPFSLELSSFFFLISTFFWILILQGIGAVLFCGSDWEFPINIVTAVPSVICLCFVCGP
jgi:hypothetical protein